MGSEGRHTDAATRAASKLSQRGAVESQGVFWTRGEKHLMTVRSFELGLRLRTAPDNSRSGVETIVGGKSGPNRAE